jgi:hypothetical protein
MLVRNSIQSKIERVPKFKEVSSVFVYDNFFCPKAFGIFDFVRGRRR